MWQQQKVNYKIYIENYYSVCVCPDLSPTPTVDGTVPYWLTIAFSIDNMERYIQRDLE